MSASITRNSRKTHENTKNKYLLGGPLNYPPVPHTKSTKINEIHEKGDRGGRKEIFSFHKGHREYPILFSDFGVRSRDSGAERLAAGYPIF